MRIDKSKYRLFTDHVEYTPEQDIKVRTALQDGLEIFEFEKMPVEVKIGDITVRVNKNSRLEHLVGNYFTKLERKGKQPYNAAYHRGIFR